mmetsp:Transcript_39844/g.78803  ORF Transcript_39844/g.78803 Transcript_39844/m.78803 type:complete len:89 (-) Transcript_39844:1321-1587(-)
MCLHNIDIAAQGLTVGTIPSAQVQVHIAGIILYVQAVVLIVAIIQFVQVSELRVAHILSAWLQGHAVGRTVHAFTHQKPTAMPFDVCR